MKIAQVLCLKDNGSPLEKICLWERLKGLEISPLTSVCNVLCKWAIPRFQFPSCLIGLSRCTFFPSTFARCNSMIEGVDILFVQTPCFWVFNFYHDLFPWMLIGACQFIVQEIIFKFTNQCKLIVSKDWKIETPIDKKGWTEMISHSIFMMQFYPSWIHNNVFLLNHFHFWLGSQNHYVSDCKRRLD